MQCTGGQLIANVLVQQGIDRIFGVPGESFLAVLDALVDTQQIEFVAAKHEGAASFMADADGKLTGRPGLVLVTRGPGASNAYAGVHVAYQDSTPLIMLVGLIGRNDEEREAFQEFDLKAIFGTQTKWTAVIDNAERIPELLTRAFQVAASGRPGPVVLGLPEDMLRDVVETPQLPAKVTPVQAAPSDAQISEIAKSLSGAKSPLVIAGGETWDEQACSDLADFAAAWHLPVTCSFRSQDRMSALHPNYIGDAGLGINPALAKRIRDADVLLVLGARLGDCTTSGYTLLDIPLAKQKILHVHPDANEIGRVYAPELGVCSGMKQALSALVKHDAPTVSPTWVDWTKAAREDYLKWSTPNPTSHGPVNLAAVIQHLNENLPEDAILTNGAGNYTVWVHRFYQHRRFRTQVAPTSGSMGYGLPAAIAASLRHPDRLSICFAGDGCFQMTLQELSTAQQFGARVIVILVNNGMYGTIRMHQEKNYPGRVSGTDIVNPDFVKLAEAYGVETARVEKTDQFAEAFDALAATGKSGVIEVITDPEDLTPRFSLSELRASAK
ncbi:thiamine pyrophosphate-binding protein [Thalassospira australica]|uniref:thiamine pyrophosphate-binding protein n=1 Tax=Thalassospira australica TaxID=1528106 RepID=UPI000519FA73|nr:thiamine pyrophosphate-binding protein [Thalassospira australica]